MALILITVLLAGPDRLPASFLECGLVKPSCSLNDGLLARERVLNRHHYAADLKSGIPPDRHRIRSPRPSSCYRAIDPSRAGRRARIRMVFSVAALPRRSSGPRGHTGEVYHAEFSPDGAPLATCGARQDRSPLGRRDAAGAIGHAAMSGEIDYVAFSPDGQILATASEDQTVRLWDVDRGMPVSKLTGHDDEVVGVAFLPDGKRLVSCGRKGLVIIWDLRIGAARWRKSRFRTSRSIRSRFPPTARRWRCPAKGSDSGNWPPGAQHFWLEGARTRLYRRRVLPRRPHRGSRGSRTGRRIVGSSHRPTQGRIPGPWRRRGIGDLFARRSNHRIS